MQPQQKQQDKDLDTVNDGNDIIDEDHHLAQESGPVDESASDQSNLVARFELQINLLRGQGPNVVGQNCLSTIIQPLGTVNEFISYKSPYFFCRAFPHLFMPCTYKDSNGTLIKDSPADFERFKARYKKLFLRGLTARLSNLTIQTSNSWRRRSNS